jgi:polar amino acid transport system substrate-binding protein
MAGLYLHLHHNDSDTRNIPIAKYPVTYRVALDDTDFPPLAIYGEGENPTGFDIDLIQWIGDEMKFNVIFVLTPWDDIFTMLDEQKVDMIMGGASITPARLEKYLFSDPYLSISQSIAIGEHSTMVMDDFYAGRGIIGVQGGTTSDDLVTEILIDLGILPEEKLIRYEHLGAGAQDLVNGDIQFLMADWPVMVALVQTHQIHIIGNIDTGEKYGIVLHKSNKGLQQLLNLGLEQLTESYDWDTMKHRYLLDY